MTAKTTPVNVVTGCLSCEHGAKWASSRYADGEYRCSHLATLATTRDAIVSGRDTPPGWCPLPEEGDEVLVKQKVKE